MCFPPRWDASDPEEAQGSMGPTTFPTPTATTQTDGNDCSAY
jgi:hypothetical protein